MGAHLPKSSYPWLSREGDGSLGADMADTTPAEMDRRMVIMQELAAGRLLLPEFTDEMVERVARQLSATYGNPRVPDFWERLDQRGKDAWMTDARAALAAAVSASSEENG